jgi:ABC-2 type transport system ATP-binding protein
MRGNFFKLLAGNKGPFIEALQGVNLKVKKGEVLGLLGPNGAGKTTLIKILCTLVIHDEGEAYVCGVDVKKEPRKVLRLLQAVLPESRGFNWRLSGKQNLEFYALLYGMQSKEASERINYLLEFTGMADRADDSYQRYSTGMQRKLLLCRALLRNTPVLLFDEPTAGLDPRAGVEFRETLRTKLAREEGKTILFSSHNLEEVQAVCDRIAILDHGKITAIDSPENIRYTATEGIQFDLSLHDAVYDETFQGLVTELEKTIGVHSVSADVTNEQIARGLTIYADKDMDISNMLEIIMTSKPFTNGARIKAINTMEPTLADAFRAITRQDLPGAPAWAGMGPGGYIGALQDLGPDPRRAGKRKGQGPPGSHGIADAERAPATPSGEARISRQRERRRQ